MPYIAKEDRTIISDRIKALANTIANQSMKSVASFAGQMNYAITRLIQEIPKALVNNGTIKEELKYWIQPLMYGVLLDVALEHKRRVNVPYEAAQIIKSGDCFDTPYQTKLVEVVDKDGVVVGHQEIMVKAGDNKQFRIMVSET